MAFTYRRRLLTNPIDALEEPHASFAMCIDLQRDVVALEFALIKITISLVPGTAGATSTKHRARGFDIVALVHGNTTPTEG